MRYFLILLTFLAQSFLWGQNTLCLGEDITICSGESVSLDLCDFSDTNVVFLNNLTTVNLDDDVYSGVVNIGFDFEFYGATYNSCVISSNGYISFDTGNANNTSDWAINSAVPDPMNPTNSIMAPWQDYNPADPGSGFVGYTTIGSPPNRTFIVMWKDQMMFGTPVSGCSALVLHETSNKIEMFLDEKPVVDWNGGASIQGTHNIDGTIAHVVPGRNWPTEWTVSLDGQSWVPDGSNSYIQTSIPYRAYVPGNAEIQWFDTDGNVYPANIDDLTVTPDPADDVDSIGYFINYSSCAVGELLTSDTTWVYLYNVEEDYTQVSCPGGDDGTAWVEVTPEPEPGVSVNYNWLNAGNQNTPLITGLEAGSYDVEVDIDGACVQTVTVVVDEVLGLNVSLINSEDVTCNSQNDGVAQIEVTQGTPPYSYNWLYPGSPSNSSSSVGATATDLYAGLNSVEVTDVNDCKASTDVVIGEPDSLSITFLTPDQDICIEDSVLLTVQGTGGSSDYTFSWSVNGDSLAETDSLWAQGGLGSPNYCVTLSESCGSPEADSCMIVNDVIIVPPQIDPDRIVGCRPLPVNFENITNASDISHVLWDYGIGYPDSIIGLSAGFYEYTIPGVYSVDVRTVTNSGCIYDTTFVDLIEVYDLPTPLFQINPNPVSIYDPIINTINQSSADAISFEWYAESAVPNYSINEEQEFKYPLEEAEYPLMLVAENELGCKDTLIQRVKVVNDVVIFAPNSFTPDGDNLNENWRVYIDNIDVFKFQLQIYNRWGELVFESFNPDGSWNGSYGGGRPVPDGTYIWKVNATDLHSDGKYEFHGYVTVIR